jgi:hypothetical protein
LQIILACSTNDKGGDLDKNTKYTQSGNASIIDWSGYPLRVDTLKESRVFDESRKFYRISDDLWIFEIGKVSLWGVSGDIPDSLMFLQQNSIAVLDENADLPKVLALRFLRIIVKEDYPFEKLLLIAQNYKGILMNIVEGKDIVFTSDGICWY